MNAAIPSMPYARPFEYKDYLWEVEKVKAAFEKNMQPSFNLYYKIRSPFLAEYTKLSGCIHPQYCGEPSEEIDAAWDAFKKADDQAYADYDKIRASALVECKKACAKLLAEYNYNLY